MVKTGDYKNKCNKNKYYQYKVNCNQNQFVA